MKVQLIDEHNTRYGVLRLQKIKCGKKACWCARGKGRKWGHGPYWYAIRSSQVNGKQRLKTKYIGKYLPREMRQEVNRLVLVKRKQQEQPALMEMH